MIVIGLDLLLAGLLLVAVVMGWRLNGRLSALRAALRGQMMTSPILDQAGFIRAIEKAFDALLAHEQRD